MITYTKPHKWRVVMTHGDYQKTTVKFELTAPTAMDALVMAPVQLRRCYGIEGEIIIVNIEYIPEKLS